MKSVLTAVDIRNGWTEQKLEAYHRERDEQQAEYSKQQEKRQPVKVENTKGYNPHNF